MKISYFFFVLLIVACNALSAQPYITKFDVPSMANKLIPELVLKTNHVHWVYGRRYIFENDNKDYLNFTIGLHTSKKKAIEIADGYLKSIPVKINEDTINLNKIGERLWCNINYDGTITSVIFLRNNALIFLSSQHFNGSLLLLAKTIDNSLKSGSSFVEIGNKVDGLSVQPIVSFGSNGTNATIHVNSKLITDSLEYSFLPGITKRNGQYIINNVEKFKKNMGKQETIKVVGITKYNVVSEITEFKLKE